MARTVEQARTLIAARLRGRQAEVEQATLTRMYAISRPSTREGPEYAHGLRAAVSVALEHGLAALERSGDSPPPIPPVLLAQARMAARAGVSLDTVLRRYLAGYTLLGDLVIQEAAAEDSLKGNAYQELLRGQAALLDRLLAAVGEEYRREQSGLLNSAEQRRADRVRRLLAGELVGTADLAYELDGHHLGLVAVGAEAAEALQRVALSRDCRLLLVRREEGAVWAWLGSRREFDSDAVDELLDRTWPVDLTLAVGEPGAGLEGWRLTHRQARAALPIALRGGQRAVRYSGVALLASMLRDDLLVASLRELYSAPLAGKRDGGLALKETLLVYFANDRNVTSAAAVLKVARRTVQRRLQAAERLLGGPLSAHAAELEAALRLEQLNAPWGRWAEVSRGATQKDLPGAESTRRNPQRD
ncbi:MAG TPA: helix-turn-helix domain-containing protein [Solirubrobacterales bacterium]|nr:helix-turn-helix domain-containing protein [Solirubrobacterales bacterium]